MLEGSEEAQAELRATSGLGGTLLDSPLSDKSSPSPTAIRRHRKIALVVKNESLRMDAAHHIAQVGGISNEVLICESIEEKIILWKTKIRTSEPRGGAVL